MLAVDMYDHGDSRWKDEIKVGEQFATFWIYSQIDAANYMAGQDYTMKAEMHILQSAVIPWEDFLH